MAGKLVVYEGTGKSVPSYKWVTLGELTLDSSTSLVIATGSAQAPTYSKSSVWANVKLEILGFTLAGAPLAETHLKSGPPGGDVESFTLMAWADLLPMPVQERTKELRAHLMPGVARLSASEWGEEPGGWYFTNIRIAAFPFDEIADTTP